MYDVVETVYLSHSLTYVSRSICSTNTHTHTYTLHIHTHTHFTYKQTHTHTHTCSLFLANLYVYYEWS